MSKTITLSELELRHLEAYRAAYAEYGDLLEAQASVEQCEHVRRRYVMAALLLVISIDALAGDTFGVYDLPNDIHAHFEEIDANTISDDEPSQIDIQYGGDDYFNYFD
jgi:hypothetical protein